MSEAEKAPDWIQDSAVARRTRCYDSWTDEHKAAVAEAVEWRGKGFVISAKKVAEEIERRGGRATKTAIDVYCHEVLGRKSFASP